MWIVLSITIQLDSSLRTDVLPWVQLITWIVKNKRSKYQLIDRLANNYKIINALKTLIDYSLKELFVYWNSQNDSQNHTKMSFIKSKHSYSKRVCVADFSRTKAAGGGLQCWGFLHHQFGPVCVLIYTRCPWSNDLKFCES